MKTRILEALRPRGSRILSLSDLSKAVLPDADPAAHDELAAVVGELERKGELVRVRGEKLSLLENTDFLAGFLAIRGEGRAWLLSGERGVPDLPIQKGALGGSMDGDFVLVRVEKPKKPARGRAPERGRGRGPGRGGPPPRELGQVVRILVRRHETIVGRIARGPDGTVLVPFDRKVDALIRIPDGYDLEAPTGIYVETRLLSYPDEQRAATAEVTELIGFEGDPGVDVEVVARKWKIPRAHPEAVLAEAAAADGAVSPEERATRSDFTDRVIVTIDGETARDFDDAIEAEELPDGGFRVGVHIADVSHYVREGTLLDAEAYERGTSVYFPDRAIAMLPERLSNDLCSLRPDEERRTVSAILTIDRHGETVKADFHRSLIRSRRRLTYTMVAALFDGAKPEVLGIGEDVAGMLAVARKAGRLIRERRDARGSLDFDLPSADVLLGETGDVVSIVTAVRNEAHRLIEDLMIAANEAVAKHLDGVPAPAVYRVHDKPDETRLSDLRVVLSPLGYDLPEDPEEITPAVFQELLADVEGTPEERFVTELVLRSQKKALYSPECRGHYALAAPYYCHFTSPIRRYPDLLVHRALCAWIETRRAPGADEAAARTAWLEDAASQSGSRERRAESAEREAVAWKKFTFLCKRVGEEFEAYVSAVVSFGLFITLDDVFVDGLVPMSAFEDDFYRFEDVEHRLVGANHGRIYRLGDRLRVQLVQADFDKRALNFKPIGESAGPRRMNRVEAIERRRLGRGERRRR